MDKVKPRWGGDFWIPICELVTVVCSKLIVVKVFIHIGFRDDDIEEIKKYEVGEIDVEEEFKYGVALLEDGCFLFLESQKRLHHLHSGPLIRL